MTQPFLGEIRMFAGTFAPRGWALCDGQLIQIRDNEALFSLLGTTYGGDGRTTFGLPELRGRLPIHQGTGPGLPRFQIGQKAGTETEIVSVGQLPNHTHTPGVDSNAGSSPDPGDKVPALSPAPTYTAETPDTLLSDKAIGDSGGSQAHNNVMPFLCVNFIIALFGTFPSRN